MYGTTYAKMVELVAGLGPDVEKANKGNKAAKVRIRQGLQVLKADAQAFRIALNEPTLDSEQS